MQNYELTVVLAGSMPEAKQKAVVDKIKKAVDDSEGSLVKEDTWGKKQFAYPIKKEKEGFYYYLELSLSTERIAGINRMIENDEQVLRHLLVKPKAQMSKTKSIGKPETQRTLESKKTKAKAKTIKKSTKRVK